MSSASPDAPLSSEAAMLLADRGWRLRHSAWLLPSILACGFLTWAGFLYIGIRAKRRSWLLFAAAYALVFAVAIILVDTNAPETGANTNATGQWASGIIVVSGVVGIVHGLFVNRSWLRWLAGNSRSWFLAPGDGLAAAPATASTSPPPAAPLPPQLRGMGVDPTQYYAPGPAAAAAGAPTAPVAPAPPTVPAAPEPEAAAPASTPIPTLDVNTATADQLGSLPGFDAGRVALVLGARDRTNGFLNVEEFATVAGLAPHEFARLRGSLVCSGRRDDGRRGPTSGGRIVDF